MENSHLRTLCASSPFTTNIEASTDVHAGRNFFCVLYRGELVFRANGEVELNYRVLDNWRPLDDEAESLSERSTRGTVTIDSAGNLKITFPNMTFWGAAVQKFPRSSCFSRLWVQYPANIHEFMGGDTSDLPKDFTESVVFGSSGK